MTRRRGIVLAAAIGLLALLGIIIAGALASSTAARRATWLGQSDAVLSASADYALGATIAGWQEFLLSDLPLGVPRTLDFTVAQSAPVRVSVVVTRLPNDLLWLVSDARGGDIDRGRRRFSLVARFGVPGAPPPAGIVARGSVHLGNAVRTTIDTTGEVDCVASPTTAHVIIAPGDSATVGDSVRVSSDARALDSATYYLTSRQLTWFDSAAGVRHVRGDTTIDGGSYQGILLIDGALHVTKPFTIVGLAIARGPIEGSDSVFVTGAMESFASSPQTAISLVGGAIQYAPCIVARMLRRASPPRPVRERSWSEIF